MNWITFVRWLVFGGVSIALLIHAWPYLLRPTRHGFYRFFAFETLLLLVLLNAEAWFQDPFSIVHIFSWAALLGSIVLAVHGFYLLHKVGKPQGDFENTTHLVVQGAYRYIRHPLYASLFLLGAGIFLKDPSLTGFSLLIALCAFLYGTGRCEEVENIERFGQTYLEYMTRTRMFIPFIF